MDFYTILTTFEGEWSYLPPTHKIIITSLFAILFVGLVGNVLVIVVVVKIPQMKTATNYFVLNLAVADLLVYIFWFLPGLIRIIDGGMKMHSLMCKAGPYFEAVAVCASAYSLAGISGGRLMATWFPLRRKVTKSVVRRIIVMIWIWATGLNLPFIILFYLKNPDNLEQLRFTCTVSWPPGLQGNIYFVLVHLGLFYLLPLSFISFCYFGIWLRVRHRNVPTDASTSQMELVHQRTKASVTKLAIIVVAVFAVSWLPLYVTLLWIKIPMLSPLGETAYNYLLVYALPIAQVLGFANSSMNPILYAFFNQNFRFALKRLIRGPPTYTRPMSCPTPHLLNNRNEAAGCRTNSDRFNMELQPSHPRSSQLNSTRPNASDRRVSDVVMLHQKELPANSRSLTF